MVKRNVALLKALFGTLLAVIFVAILTAAIENNFVLGKPGTTDFVQYWSAFQALQQGQNPYDGVVLHEIQRSVGQHDDSTILMWNPPWTCLMLAPFLALPFSYGAAAWFIFSASLLLLIATVVTAENSELPLPYAVLAALLFYPVIECLSLGQLSLFLASAFALTLYFLQRRRPIAVGLSIIPLTLKPHLFFLLIPIAFVWLSRLSSFERRKLLLTTCSAMLLLYSATESLWPGSTTAWLAALGSEPRGPGAVPTSMWMTATVTTFIRSLLVPAYGYPPEWPLVVIPTAAFLAVSAWVFSARQAMTDLRATTLSIMCLSLLFGNYGWLFDQALLLPCYFAIITAACSTEQRRLRYVLLGGLIAILLVAVAMKLMWSETAQHHYVWIPFVILLLFRLQESRAAKRLCPASQIRGVDGSGADAP